MHGRVETTNATEATLTASRALLGVVTRSLADVLDRITLQQWRVLVLVASRGPLRSGVIAESLGVHPSTFTRTADRMVTSGLLVRGSNPGSRREVLIELAPAGRQMLDVVTQRRRAELALILDRLSAAQREQVLEGMRLFADAAGEPAADDPASLGL